MSDFELTFSVTLLWETNWGTSGLRLEVVEELVTNGGELDDKEGPVEGKLRDTGVGVDRFAWLIEIVEGN